MSLLFRNLSATQLIAEQRHQSSRFTHVTSDSARRHSAVWACLRLRADLISTLPVDTFRRSRDGYDMEVKSPPIITEPGGPECLSTEWRYSSQIDLDGTGNCFGWITHFDSAGRPGQIDLISSDIVTVRVAEGQRRYRFNGEDVPPERVWHERQWTLPGVPVGLSPLAYAAYSIGQYLSAQQFARDWFGSGSIPAGHLRNVKKTLKAEEVQVAKSRFKAAIEDRDVFVTGADWEYNMLAVKANESQFIEAMRFGAADICRFFGVPASAIDADNGGAGNSLTYANITQADLHLLVRNLAPSIARREEVWSKRLTTAPRFIKFNTDALLRMDPQSRQQMIREDVAAKLRTYTEARALMNLPPLTSDDLAEFVAVNPAKSPPDKGTP